MESESTQEDNASFSGYTTISTRGSLKRKSMSPPSVRVNNSKSELPLNNTKYFEYTHMTKEEAKVLFPTCGSNKNFTVIEDGYGLLPCRV